MEQYTILIADKLIVNFHYQDIVNILMLMTWKVFHLADLQSYIGFLIKFKLYLSFICTGGPLGYLFIVLNKNDFKNIQMIIGIIGM